ncbi:hypothetical protein [Streptomyces sp. NBC_01439]|uniref:hypothetical protein n=1 Tax=Streptomyces sp. NBC_01439 TaxID=2903867 RepID=UPI002E2DC744|nr:hypothetical protein [Streptomyces sp. NBC_01439]
MESLTALKTERTEHFIKALDHRLPGRIPLDEAKELAREFGGRMDRKFRSATNALNHWRPQQVTPALERACEQGWAERGLGLDCEQCKLHSFIPLQASTSQAICPACSTPDRYGRDNGKSVEIMYRLNGFIDRAVDNGVLTHLLVVAALQKRAPDSHFLPGVDVVFDDGDTKEVDIFGVYEGKVLAGEAKVSATEFANEGQIRRDIELSRRLKADVHVMAAIATSDLVWQKRVPSGTARPSTRHGRSNADDESRSSPRNGCHPADVPQCALVRSLPHRGS